MTIPWYKSGKSIMTAAYYKSGNDDNKFDNNKYKVYLLLKRWGLLGYVLYHILYNVLDYMLDYILDHRIISFVTTALHK